MYIAASRRTNWSMLLFALCAPVWAQNGLPVPRERLLENASRLDVTMSLDRQEYLPGEMAELTIAIANPTSQALDIPQPFSLETGGLRLLENNPRSPVAPGTGWVPAVLGPDDAPQRLGRERPLPSIRIGPGETITRKFRSFDPSAGPAGWDRLIYSGSVPTWAGDFRLEYWGGHVDFRVMWPSFESMTTVYLPEWENSVVGPRGETQKRQRRTFVFVLEAEGRHYICLLTRGLAFSPDPVRRFQPGRVPDRGMEQLIIYTRIGESDSPVRSLHAESDPNGTIIVTWGANGEGWRRLLQDEWRLAPPEAPGGKK